MGRYKKMYNLGGAIVPKQALTNGLAIAAGGANTFADILDRGNRFGRQSGLTSGFKQGASLASIGASLGGPAGAIVGGGLGLASGLISSIGAKDRERRMEARISNEDRLISEEEGMNSIRRDRSSVRGSHSGGFFKNGGSLTEAYMSKGKKLSNQAVEIEGPSHENGGVMLPGGNEVEGKETISGGFVFSHELGFAKEHKPIAKAIGALEDKPMNPIRRKTMIRLKDREQELAYTQELLKEQLNIQ